MKNKIILFVAALLVFGCQKSNSSPDSANSNIGNGTATPPVAAVPSSPAQEEWQKKLEACPLQISKEMSLEQVAETSNQMRQRCGFTETEWAQVIQHGLK